MNKPHKSQFNSGNNIKSKEEQRELLCGYKAGTRCSSLDFEEKKLTDEEIDSFIAFALILKQIHVRLVMEGYTIEKGRIYKKE